MSQGLTAEARQAPVAATRSVRWIKMRSELLETREVMGMARLLQMHRLDVVGRLWRFWAWSDSKTVDGWLPDLTVEEVDFLVETDGFAQAMQRVGWLVIQPDGMRIPDFAAYLGEYDRKRAEHAARQAAYRERQASRDCHVTVTKRHQDQDQDQGINRSPLSPLPREVASQGSSTPEPPGGAGVSSNKPVESERKGLRAELTVEERSQPVWQRFLELWQDRPGERGFVRKWLRQVPEAWVLKAFDAAASGNGNTVHWCEPMLERWKAQGGPPENPQASLPAQAPANDDPDAAIVTKWIQRLPSDRQEALFHETRQRFGPLMKFNGKAFRKAQMDVAREWMTREETAAR
ncbi:MAG: hypothetical protein ACYCW6_00210 [Candidatus Xenobia bacterium]